MLYIYNEKIMWLKIEVPRFRFKKKICVVSITNCVVKLEISEAVWDKYYLIKVY